MNDHDLELLSAYLDDELSNEERAELEQRLQNETNLRRELELMRATVSLVSSLSLLKAPRDFTLKTLPKSANPKISVFPRLVSFASAAAAILLFVAGFSILNTGSSMQPPTNAVMMNQEVAALPTATIVPMTTIAITETPPPTILQYAEEIPETSETQLQPESALPAPSDALAAGGAPALAVVAPTESAPTIGDVSDGFAVGSMVQESMDTSASVAESENSGPAAVPPGDKTLTPAVVNESGLLEGEAQIPPATASPLPTLTYTPEPPAEVSQNATTVQEAPTPVVQESQVAETGSAQRNIAPVEDSDSTLGIVLLVVGTLLMLVAIGLFIRSRRAVSNP